MQPRSFGVIGDPIAHSLSPIIHEALYRAMELPFTYGRERVEKGDLSAFIRRLPELGWDGFNITMPHKKDILPFLEDVEGEAAVCESVNTVRVDKGRLYGTSTDGPGFHLALQQVGFDVSGAHILILGAGGVTKALAYRLAEGGAEAITVLNRTVSKARDLADFIYGRWDVDTAYGPLDLDEMESWSEDADLLINTTALGMAGFADFPSFAFLEALNPDALVADLIYHPRPTSLLAAARELELTTLDGLPMLINQAVYAFEFMTGLAAPKDAFLVAGNALKAHGVFQSH